jgi:hypothetical protein
MLTPVNLVHQRQLQGFPQDFHLVFDPQYVEPMYWEVPQEYAPAPVQPVQEAGMTFGTFLALRSEGQQGSQICGANGAWRVLALRIEPGVWPSGVARPIELAGAANGRRKEG